MRKRFTLICTLFLIIKTRSSQFFRHCRTVVRLSDSLIRSLTAMHLLTWSGGKFSTSEIHEVFASVFTPTYFLFLEVWFPKELVNNDRWMFRNTLTVRWFLISLCALFKVNLITHYTQSKKYSNLKIICNPVPFHATRNFFVAVFRAHICNVFALEITSSAFPLTYVRILASEAASSYTFMRV